MTTFRIGLIILLIFIPVLLFGDDEIKPSDSLIIAAVEVAPGEQAVVDIEFVNTEVLGAVTIPLYIHHDRARFDSVSFIGSRLEYLSMRPVTITARGQVVVFGAICMTEDFIPPGQGLLARLHISIKDSAGMEPIVIDTTTVHPASLLFTRSNSYSYIPVFESGKIEVTHELIKDK